jgi:hypothetical protein
MSQRENLKNIKPLSLVVLELPTTIKLDLRLWLTTHFNLQELNTLLPDVLVI